MAEKIIQLKELKKIYKVGKERINALDGIDLDIEQGEVLGICGTSGSGKSTILNLIAGLEPPTSGQIFYMGKDITNWTESQKTRFRRNKIGFIFQSYNLISSYTALENVSLPLMFRGYNKHKRHKLAAKALKEVELLERRHHKPTQMSGGQQQRVGIARALVGNPSIICADEPTGNLDSHTSLEVMKIMIDTIKKNNQTLILVSHDPNIASYADKVIHITDGCIDKLGL